MPKPIQFLNSDTEHRSPTRPSEGHRVFAAGLFVVAWLSFIAFVALYRAPLPTDAFTALTLELVAPAEAAGTR